MESQSVRALNPLAKRCVAARPWVSTTRLSAIFLTSHPKLPTLISVTDKHLPTVIGDLIINEIAPKRIELPEVAPTPIVYPIQVAHHMEWEDKDGTLYVHDIHTVWPDGYSPPFESPKPDPYSWIASGQIAQLAVLLIDNRISHGAAKQVITELYEHGGEVTAIIERLQLWQSNEVGELKGWITDAIAANPKAVAEFRAGNERAINSIKGAVMKASKGKANPKLVDQMLRDQLKS